jgi:hypothetical protein
MALHLQNGNPADICYCLEENYYKNHRTLQMTVLDIKPCSTKETPKAPPAAEEASK